MDQPNEDEAYKFGVQYEPPSLVYVYRDKTSRKLTRYMISVPNFGPHSDCNSVALDIKTAYEDKLKPISLDQVETALSLLLSHMKCDDPTKSKLRNRRLFHVGSKVKPPEHSLRETLSKLSIEPRHEADCS